MRARSRTCLPSSTAACAPRRLGFHVRGRWRRSGRGGHPRWRLTEDVDVVTDDQGVLEEATLLARERGLPENWLNPNARMWMPPLPGGVLDRPDAPGLRVTYANEEFLFATKLIAQRARDADDVVALAKRLGMQDASADDAPSRTSGATTPMKRPWSSSSMATTPTRRSATCPRMPRGC